MRKAYRQASLKYHPDKVQGTEKEIEKATEIFRDIQDAVRPHAIFAYKALNNKEQ